MDWLTTIQQQWQAQRGRLDAETILARTIKIQQIPAPTFDEEARAHYIADQFEKLGLSAISRDALHNVVGWLHTPASTTQPILLITAHSDTVFPMETSLAGEKQGNRYYAPGIGDNSLGVGALLTLAEILVSMRDKISLPIGFVVNSREEGLGNLDGIRAVIASLPQERIRAGIVLEGMALGRIYHAGIAVRRLKISTTAEGGHSWLHFGQANAIHDLVRLCADLSQIDVPVEPRTTYNIGIIEGGQSINSIPTHASCSLDMRSTTSEGLATLEAKVMAVITKHQQHGAQVTVEVIGDRPGGYLSPNHYLIEMAQATHHMIGVQPILDQGSTDANCFFAQNIPAVVVGVTYGGNAHRLDEYIELEPLKDGMWALLVLVAGVIEKLQQN